tara:strand:- start:24598 stop:24783 length:186 start_codon:yes stop_codon:yes gene_type:complete
MKALILSLVIAFSSSFALADCTQADSTFNSTEGAYTKADKEQPAQATPLHVASTPTNGVPK